MHAQNQSKKATKLAEDFISAALSENEIIKYPVRKWQKDTISYYIYGEQTVLRRKNWDQFLYDVSVSSGLYFQQVDQYESADILMYFGTVSSYLTFIDHVSINSNLTNYSNWSSRKWKKTNELSKSSFCVDTAKLNNSNEAIYYLKKYFIKSLGILGDVPGEYSLFNAKFNGKNYNFLTADKRLLKLLYDKRISSGMNESELRTILKSMDLEVLSNEKL